MKHVARILAVAALLAVPARGEEQPQTVAYYYKVRWGFQEEFERLFLKNHLPILTAQKGTRIRDVSLYTPKFHGDGRGDWTFLVVITYASWAAVGEAVDEKAIARRLFPDQEAYAKEEQRRFELLEAHWDVPLARLAAAPPPQ